MVGWHILTPAQGPDTPTLFIKHEFTATGYSVYVTDLTNIWEESLDRRNVIKRALQDDTSIDPSEATDQLKLLLDRIEAALTGESDTSRRLLPTKDETSLSLELHASLPTPLEEVVWAMSLRQRHGSVLFRELFLPALERSLRAQRRVDSLLSHVREKDHVILRLVDKLESSGIELANVFPGAQAARGPKGTVRETLVRAVPGLRPFDETQWHRTTDNAEIADSSALVKEVLADLQDSDLVTDWESPGHWWTAITPNGQDLNVASSTQPSISDTASRTKPKQHQDEEDEFQVQVIAQPQNSRTVVSKVLVKDSQPPVLEPSGDAMSTTDDGENQDDKDLDELTESQMPGTKSAYRQASLPAPAARKRLGILGKQKRASPPSQSPTLDSMPVEMEALRTTASPAETTRKKLGRIGGSRQRPGDTEMTDVPIRQAEKAADGKAMPGKLSAVAGGVEQEEIPAETEEEKAERRRAELKQRMEASKQAPPKKKRKF